MNIRRHLKSILAGLGMMLIAGTASAQEYPSKPVTLIIPWPAGGPTDVTMRAKRPPGRPMTSATSFT